MIEEYGNDSSLVVRGNDMLHREQSSAPLATTQTGGHHRGPTAAQASRVGVQQVIAPYRKCTNRYHTLVISASKKAVIR